MAVVTNWEKPLKEALATKLQKKELSPGELSKLETAIGMLYGQDIPAIIKDKLEERKLQRDKRYEQVLKMTRKGISISTVEKGITELKEFGTYREAPQEVEAAQKRVKALNKRNKIIALMAAAVLGLFIAIAMFKKNEASRRVSSEIEQAKLLAEEGKTAEAVDALSDIVEQGGLDNRHYTQLQEVTDILVIKTTEEEGIIAAYDLYSDLKSFISQSGRGDIFKGFVGTQLRNEEVPAPERWDLFKTATEREGSSSIPDFGNEEIANLLNECLLGLAEELESGTQRDMEAWSEKYYSYMDEIHVDPDAALRFLYALIDSGYDIYELFPEGLSVNVSMADRVTGLINNILEDTEPDQHPQLITFLPVSLREKNDYQGDKLYQISVFDKYDLDITVSNMQRDDEHYEVRILTEYLERIPEEMWPASFSESSCLLCMQMTYLYSGCVSEITSTGSLKSTKYRPMYSALEMVVLYDMHAEDLPYTQFYLQIHPAKMEDDDWFEKNKSSFGFLSESNLMGVFDTETLTEEYEGWMGLADLFKDRSNSDRSDLEEEEAHDAE